MTAELSVCIDAVLEDEPLPQALQTVARSGVRAFEFWMWWEKPLDELLTLRDQLDLTVAACCTKFVSLVDPAVRDDYLLGLQASIETAKRLACPTLISQVGDARPGVPRQVQRDCLVDGLRAAADILAGTDVTLAIEPLNELVDHPGYYLLRSDEAFQIVDEVNSPQVKVTFDIYHQQISEGNLIPNIQQNIDKIAHFHAAGQPGRHELNCGEIHYPAIWDAIQATDYDGYIGLEYWPKQDAESGIRRVVQEFQRGSISDA